MRSPTLLAALLLCGAISCDEPPLGPPEPGGPDGALPADVADLAEGAPCVGASCEAEVARRAAAMVAEHAARPWPAKGTCWGDVTWAFSALSVGGDVQGANGALAALPKSYALSAEPTVEDDCYWANSLLARSLLLPSVAARLDQAARGALLEVMWSYVRKRSLVAEALGSAWTISGSANHDSMRKGSYLLFTQALLAAGRGGDKLADGRTAAEHHAAWTRYFMEYFRQRAREGIDVEIASPTYAGYGLQVFVNVRDLADSEALRKQADAFLALFFADYAQDFLPAPGVRGGAMTRVYKDESLTQGTRENLRPTTWMYGWHEAAPGNTNPLTLIMATSAYRPPPIVAAMATRAAAHAYVSRRPGLGRQTTDLHGIAYEVTFPGGGSSIRRHSYWTPAYVLGSLSIDLGLDYIALNDQNRAMGVLFASGVNQRIIIAGKGTDQDGRRGSAEIHGVSGRDCLIVARDQKATLSTGTRIFVSSGPTWDNQVQRGGWLFTRSGDGYAAVRVATGTWVVTSVPDGKMLDLSDMWAPVVLQLGQSADYASFDAFQASVVANSWDYSGGRLRYQSEAGATFEVFRQAAQAPRIDGAPVDLNPELSYDSPYLRGTHGEDRIQLQFPGMAPLGLEFSY